MGYIYLPSLFERPLSRYRPLFVSRYCLYIYLLQLRPLSSCCLSLGPNLKSVPLISSLQCERSEKSEIRDMSHWLNTLFLTYRKPNLGCTSARFDFLPSDFFLL